MKTVYTAEQFRERLVDCDHCGGCGKVQVDASYGEGHLGFHWVDCGECDDELVAVEFHEYRLTNVDFRDNLEGECWLVVDGEPCAFFDYPKEFLNPDSVHRFIQEELNG